MWLLRKPMPRRPSTTPSWCIFGKIPNRRDRFDNTPLHYANVFYRGWCLQHLAVDYLWRRYTRKEYLGPNLSPRSESTILQRLYTSQLFPKTYRNTEPPQGSRFLFLGSRLPWSDHNACPIERSKALNSFKPGVPA